MAVHRIDDNAEAILQRLAAADGKKPSEWLSQLIRNYDRGLTFDDVPVKANRAEQELADAQREGRRVRPPWEYIDEKDRPRVGDELFVARAPNKGDA